MRSKGWDAVVLTGSDPHSSEYPAARWKQVEWLCGFTGEAGDLVVTLDHAGLWTDTRYFIQANAQLAETGVELHKTRVPEQVLIPEWLFEKFNDTGVIAVDGLCMSAEAAKELPGSIISVPDLLDKFWEDRPSIPCTPIFTIKCGESRADKIAFLRKHICSLGCSGILLSSLDEIAWILNVRGSDIEYNPLVISYLLVTPSSTAWYVEKDSFGESLPEQTSATFSILESEGVKILPYSDISLLPYDFEGSLLVDEGSVNYDLFSILDASESVRLRPEKSPVPLRKAVKNPTEIEGMRRAHILDGVAMEKFLYWVEREVKNGNKISEWDASLKLQALRAEIPGYRGDSFEVISAYGKGAALPHYVTPSGNAPLLEAHGLYLCDSGGQYDYGTTDITRTIPLGECTPLEREDYTLVLKGHIALAMAVFPEGTPGCRLDVLARNALWQSHRNFGHGTGHGVGFFLGVHEGPQDIRQNLNATPLLPGMITSDEPGIYREGMHGVRHENLLLCTEAGENEFGRWLCFETLTCCHFDTSALNTELLTAKELAWLNDYNNRVYSTLAQYLNRDERDWLKEKTIPVK